jgi:phosphate transport system permease protein
MIVNKGLYRRRKLSNGIFLVLSMLAAGFGLVWLALILSSLLVDGFSSLSPKLFTMMTPPPMMEGGLANAIFGSVLMSTIAVAVGTPIGILAGTYLAEYGRHSRLSFFVRFINDILLSAPSIIVGLFVYVAIVVNRPETFAQKVCDTLLGSECFMGHFSGWAGSIALAIIVIPVVVRTTENMLILVPNGLREAGASIGAPRSTVIRSVTWRAARAGIITGMLLAVARISGETAPLLFTAFNNQFWSHDMNGPMASLPYVIFTFAMSPDAGWHKLAWAGALLVTAAVLTLSITARLLERKRS